MIRVLLILQQDSNVKENTIIYLSIHSLFNNIFLSWATVPAILLDSGIKWLAGWSLVLPWGLMSNKKSVLNITKGKYKLCGDERRSELQI